MTLTLEELKALIRRRLDAGILDARPTYEQRIDWAYGNAKLANDKITREMVEKAVRGADKKRNGP